MLEPGEAPETMFRALIDALKSHHEHAAAWGPIMAHPEANPILDMAQAVQYTKRHSKTLIKAAKEGELAFIQSGEGGRYLFRLRDLNAWLDTLSSSKAEPPRESTREPQWGI